VREREGERESERKNNKKLLTCASELSNMKVHYRIFREKCYFTVLLEEGKC
jgi:hypothetical protein